VTILGIITEVHNGTCKNVSCKCRILYYIYLSKWIQLQYGGECDSNLRAFHVNQHDCMSGDMSLEGASYVQDFHQLFL